MMASFRSYAFQRSSSVHCSSHLRCCGLLRLPLPCTKRICRRSSSSLEPMRKRSSALFVFPVPPLPLPGAFGWVCATQRCTGRQRFPALSRRCIPFCALFRPCPPVSSQTDRTGPPPLPGSGPCGTCKRRVIRRFLILQQPSEVDPILTGFLQLPAGIDPTQISMDHDLEQHPWIRCRFSPSGRIRFVQFPVLQFLKLRA